MQTQFKIQFKNQLQQYSVHVFEIKCIQILCETSLKTHCFSCAVIISSICCSIFLISSHGINFAIITLDIEILHHLHLIG